MMEQRIYVKPFTIAKVEEEEAAAPAAELA